MKISRLIILTYVMVCIFSCSQELKTEVTIYDYYDKSEADTIKQENLIAVSYEEHLQYGSPVAYLNFKETLLSHLTSMHIWEPTLLPTSQTL